MIRKIFLSIIVTIVSFSLAACSDDASAMSSDNSVEILTAEEAERMLNAKDDSEDEITVDNTVIESEESTEAEEESETEEISKWDGNYVSVKDFINGDQLDLEGFFKANGAVVKYYEYDENYNLKEVDHESFVCKAWFDEWYITVASGSVQVANTSTGYHCSAITREVDMQNKVFANSAGLEPMKDLVEPLDDITYLVLTHPNDYDPLEESQHRDFYS